MKLILILLFVVTPMGMGSTELWAFSTMELGILLLIILWAIQGISIQPSAISGKRFRIPMILLSLFLCLVLFQMLNLPSKVIEIISPKTFEVRQQLQLANDPSPMISLSFFPYATKTEFFKWVTLAGFFLFLLHWKPLANDFRTLTLLMLVILIVGFFESLYGIGEVFGKTSDPAGMGTFVNRNHFAGYLLMVIPLTIGFLFSREANQSRRFRSWVQHLSSLDGRGLLIGFSVIVIILGLVFSASRMGISSLLLSFTLLTIFVRSPGGESTFSKKSVLILGLALIWAGWIGLDAVISRFFSSSEDFGKRWEIWVGTLQIIKGFPLFGSGLGTFVQVFPMHSSIHVRGLVTHAENDFLQLASEVGLIGFGVLLALFVFLFFKVASGLRKLAQGDPRKYIGVGALIGILALMFHSLVEKNIQVPANSFLYAFLWVVVLQTTRTRDPLKSSSPTKREGIGSPQRHRGH